MNFARIVLLLIVALLPMAASAEEVVTIKEDGWAEWSAGDEEIFKGQWVAADPSVILDNGVYRMFYTCIDPEEKITYAVICSATSPDGMSWTNVDTGGEIEGLVLAGRLGMWDEHLETSFVMKRGDTYWLYYSGYKTEGLPVIGFPASVGVATSTDGVHFTRVQDDPVLSPTSGALDNDAVYAPTIVEANGQLTMIYAGHCYNNCPNDEDSDVTLMAATSSDGVSWTKQADPVLISIDAIDWMKDGVSDPDLTLGPDGRYYLFFVGVRDDERHIGVAVGDSPSGPWQLNPGAIVLPSPGFGFNAAGVFSPSVLIDSSHARMWYRGTAPNDGGFAIGYAETAWPVV
jgi:predicted GH43/DUF377 family glycosyl hydrolase